MEVQYITPIVIGRSHCHLGFRLPSNPIPSLPNYSMISSTSRNQYYQTKVSYCTLLWEVHMSPISVVISYTYHTRQKLERYTLLSPIFVVISYTYHTRQKIAKMHTSVADFRRHIIYGVHVWQTFFALPHRVNRWSKKHHYHTSRYVVRIKWFIHI